MCYLFIILSIKPRKYMETTNAANEFVGSPAFMMLLLVGGVIIAFLLRMTFKSSNSEYRHRPDE